MMPSVGQVYLAEVLDTRRRDIFGPVLSISINIGITLTYIFGSLLHWIIVAWLFLGFILIQCLCLCWVAESPQWLMAHGWPLEAEKSLRFLRGQNYDIDQELSCLKTVAKEANIQAAASNWNLWKEFLKPEAYKPLLILMTLWLLLQFSGVYAVIFYAVDIFEGNVYWHAIQKR